MVSDHFLAELALGPIETGPARNMLEIAPKINTGDQVECHFVTFFLFDHRSLNLNSGSESHQIWFASYTEVSVNKNTSTETQTLK